MVYNRTQIPKRGINTSSTTTLFTNETLQSEQSNMITQSTKTSLGGKISNATDNRYDVMNNDTTTTRDEDIRPASLTSTADRVEIDTYTSISTTEKYHDLSDNITSYHRTSYNITQTLTLHQNTSHSAIGNTVAYNSNVSSTTATTDELNQTNTSSNQSSPFNIGTEASLLPAPTSTFTTHIDNATELQPSNYSYQKVTTAPNYSNGTHDYFINSNATTMETLSSTTNETFVSEIEYLYPGQTSSNSFDNLSTNYHVDYHNAWGESFNTTINESLVKINDSFFFISPYNNDRSNSLFNGMAKIDSSPETITKVFILALVSIFGSIGNFLVVGSVIKNRNLHRPPFYFLLSMGITDLARAGFCLPVVMATALQGSIWRHGDTACKMFAFAASFFVFSSTLSLLVIAIERHLSIVHAKAYRRRCHGFVNLFATIFIWVTAFLISFPPIFSSIGAGEYVFISEEAQCAYDHKHFSHNDGLNSVLTFVGITSLTLFLYYRIFVFMRSHRRMRPLQHRPAFSSTWTFVGPGANGQAFINWLNGFGGNASNVYQRPTDAASATASASGNNSSSAITRFGRSGHSRGAQRLNFGRVVNLCTTRNEHLTRLFFIMTTVHGATWVPYVILSLWRVFVTSSDIPVGFIAYAAWLSYAQVAICPMAYFLSRGRSKSSSKVIHMESTERNEFLLENKIPK